MTDTSILGKNTSVEEIIAYLQDPEKHPLQSIKMQERLDRIIAIDGLNRLYKRAHKVIQMHMHRFGVSFSTAKRDYYEMQRVLNNFSTFSKEYERSFIMEWIKEEAAKASAEGNFKDFNALMKTYHMYGQFDQEEIELPQQNLEAHTIELTDDVTLLNIERLPNLEERKRKLFVKQQKKSQGFDDVEEVPEDEY